MARKKNVGGIVKFLDYAEVGGTFLFNSFLFFVIGIPLLIILVPISIIGVIITKLNLKWWED